MSVLRFHHEYVGHCGFTSLRPARSNSAVRWALFVTGIEALINVAFDKIAKQFTVRSVALANECGVPFSKRHATRTYSMRWHMSHRCATSLPNDELDLLIATEHVLRSAIRKAILDRPFASVVSRRFGDRAALARNSDNDRACSPHQIGVQ